MAIICADLAREEAAVVLALSVWVRDSQPSEHIKICDAGGHMAWKGQSVMHVMGEDDATCTT